MIMFRVQKNIFSFEIVLLFSSFNANKKRKNTCCNIIFIYSSYVQRPVPEMALQEALAPQAASPARREASSVDGEQIKAQYLAPPEDD